MPKDLRYFIETVRTCRPRDLASVHREVDARFEILTVLRKLQQSSRYPVVHFERVRDSLFPLISNVLADESRLPLVLECEPKQVLSAYIDRERNLLPPRLLGSGAVQDVVLTGDAIDLGRLPLTTQSARDGGAFITAGVTVVKDPSTGARNAGIYRSMRHGPALLGMSFEPQSHLGAIYRELEKRDLPLEAVIFLGHHPACLMGTQSKLPLGTDEYAIMGGLLGEPLDVVKCQTVDLEVPAYAEIAIEGRILPHVRRAEGPFGEYTLYYGYERNSPVMEVTAITHRRDAIYQDLYSVSNEHHLATKLGREAVLFQRVRASLPSVRDVHMPLSGLCRQTAYVQIAKRFDGEGKMAALAALASDSFVKMVVVVDEDIDVHNESEVWWAVTTRTQPDRATFFVPDAIGSRLDPAGYSVWNRVERDGLNTKWAIDATMPIESPFEERADVPPELLARLDLAQYIID